MRWGVKVCLSVCFPSFESQPLVRPMSVRKEYICTKNEKVHVSKNDCPGADSRLLDTLGGCWWLILAQETPLKGTCLGIVASCGRDFALSTMLSLFLLHSSCLFPPVVECQNDACCRLFAVVLVHVLSKRGDP